MRLAKSRVITFFTEEENIPGIVTTIDQEVLRRFSALPHFLGFVGLRSETGNRPEVVGISMGTRASRNRRQCRRSSVTKCTA